MAGRPPPEIVESFLVDSHALSTYELCQKYERAPSTIREWRGWCGQQGLAPGYGVPESTTPDMDEYLRLEGDFVILSDLEMPDHDAEVIDLALSVAQAFGIKKAILNGDAFTLDAFSRWLKEVVLRRSFKGELAEGQNVLLALLEYFEKIYLVTGNHEARLPWAVAGEITLGDLLSSLRNVEFSEYHYLTVNDTWRVVHPSNYSKVPLSVGRELADIYSCSIIAGHTHHLAWGYARNGKYVCVDGGCGRDPKKTEYKARQMTRHPAWNPGFVLLLNNQAYLVPKSCDLDFWLGRAQSLAPLRAGGLVAATEEREPIRGERLIRGEKNG